MKILIDNGHGSNTKGKHSPCLTFFEWEFNREIAVEVEDRLKKLGYDVERIVTEDEDVGLLERVRRVNAHCSQLGKQNVILVSIHANAAGNGTRWCTARGFEVYVCFGSSEASKRLAQSIYASAEKRDLKGNRCVPKERYWLANFTIIKRTNCPAVLTENLYYDNLQDIFILKTEKGKKKIIDLHVEGITNYLKGL